jgi:hypothetical protein
MARKRSNGSRSRLGPELEGMLADFCEAHHVANAHEITKRAIRDFILRDIAENAGVRKEYERLQKTRTQKPELKVIPLKEPLKEK